MTAFFILWRKLVAWNYSRRDTSLRLKQGLYIRTFADCWLLQVSSRLLLDHAFVSNDLLNISLVPVLPRDPRLMSWERSSDGEMLRLSVKIGKEEVARNYADP